MKSKLKGAQTGHDLLKRKSEALTKYVLIGSPRFRLRLGPRHAASVSLVHIPTP